MYSSDIIAVDFVAIRFVLVVVVPMWLHYYLSINTRCQIIFNCMKGIIVYYPDEGLFFSQIKALDGQSEAVIMAP